MPSHQSGGDAEEIDLYLLQVRERLRKQEHDQAARKAAEWERQQALQKSQLADRRRLQTQSPSVPGGAQGLAFAPTSAERFQAPFSMRDLHSGSSALPSARGSSSEINDFYTRKGAVNETILTQDTTVFTDARRSKPTTSTDEYVPRHQDTAESGTQVHSAISVGVDASYSQAPGGSPGMSSAWTQGRGLLDGMRRDRGAEYLDEDSLLLSMRPSRAPQLDESVRHGPSSNFAELADARYSAFAGGQGGGLGTRSVADEVERVTRSVEEMVHMVGEREDGRVRIAELQRELAEERKTGREWEEEVKRTRAEAGAVEQRWRAEVEKEQREIEAREKEVREMLSLLEETSEALKRGRAREGELQQMLTDSRLREASLEDIKSSGDAKEALATTETALSKAKERKKALKRERKEEAERTRDEKDAMLSEHHELAAQVKTIPGLQEAMDTAQARADKAEKELEEQRNEAAAMQAALQAERDGLSRRLTEVTSRAEMAEEELQLLVVSSREAEAEHAQQESETKEMARREMLRAEKLSREVQALQALAQDAELKMRSLQSSLHQTEQRASTTKQELEQRASEQQHEAAERHGAAVAVTQRRLSDLLARLVQGSSEHRQGLSSSRELSALLPEQPVPVPAEDAAEPARSLSKTLDEFEKSAVIWFEGEAQHWAQRVEAVQAACQDGVASAVGACKEEWLAQMEKTENQAAEERAHLAAEHAAQMHQMQEKLLGKTIELEEAEEALVVAKVEFQARLEGDAEKAGRSLEELSRAHNEVRSGLEQRVATLQQRVEELRAQVDRQQADTSQLVEAKDQDLDALTSSMRLKSLAASRYRKSILDRAQAIRTPLARIHIELQSVRSAVQDGLKGTMSEVFRLTAMQIVDAMKRSVASEAAAGMKQVQVVDRVTADAQRREQKLHDRAQSLELDLSEQKARFDSMAREKEEEVAQLRSVVDRERRQLTELQDKLNASAKALSTKDEQLEQSRSLLRRQTEEVRRLNQTGVEGSLEAKKRHHDLKTQLSDLQSKGREHEVELQSQLEKTREAAKMLGEALKTSEKFNQQLQTELARREKSAEEWGRREAELLTKCDELREQVKQQSEVANAMEQRTEQLAANSEAAHRQLAESKEALRQVQAQNQLLQRQVEETQGHAQAAHEAVKRSKAKKDAYKSKHESAEVKAQTFLSQLQEAKDLETQRIAEQNQRIEELEANLLDALAQKQSPRSTQKSRSPRAKSPRPKDRDSVRSASDRTSRVRAAKDASSLRVWRGP